MDNPLKRPRTVNLFEDSPVEEGEFLKEQQKGEQQNEKQDAAFKMMPEEAEKEPEKGPQQPQKSAEVKESFANFAKGQPDSSGAQTGADLKTAAKPTKDGQEAAKTEVQPPSGEEVDGKVQAAPAKKESQAEDAVALKVDQQEKMEQTTHQETKQVKNPFRPDELRKENEKEQVQDEKVAIKNNPQEESVLNGSVVDDDKKNKSKKIRKKAFLGLGVIVLLGLLVGGVFGIELFDTYLRKLAPQDVLPGDSSLVFKFNTDVEFEQYKLLDEHIRKFPGYRLLEKEWDDSGEGKSASEFFQDELKQNNLSFEGDVQPVLGDELFVLIPDLESFEQSVQKRMTFLSRRVASAWQQRAEQGPSSEGLLAQTDVLDETGENKVLGVTSERYVMDETGPEIEPLDFIIAAPIKDLKEAQRVLEKIKNDKETYEVSEQKIEGYTSFKVKSLTNETNQQNPVDIESTYHVLLGNNWVMATNEKDLEEMIKKRKEGHFLSYVTNLFSKDKSEMTVLGKNEKYLKTREEISATGEKSIVMGFFNLNFKKFFEIPDAQEEEVLKYFKYPDQFTGGFFFKAGKEGLVFKVISNQVSLGNVQNSPFGSGLAEKIPAMVDGRFGDLYMENDNVKDFYYDFKKSNLTKQGLDAWDEFRGEFSQNVGVDFEVDLVDQLSGNVAAVLYAKKGLEPEGVVLAQIADKQKVVSSAKKVIEAGKNIYMGFLSMGPGMLDAQMQMQMQQGMGDQQVLFDQPSPISKAQQAEAAALAEAVKNSSLVESQSENGTIYSYKLPGTEFSFDFGFSEDNMLVWGSHYAAVNGVLSELKTNKAPKLSTDKNFLSVGPNVFPEGYSKFFMNTFGVWNSFEFYADKYQLVKRPEEKEMMFAIGSIIRTVNLLGTVDAASSDGASAKSSLFLGIKELPAEQKAAAEAIIEKSLGGMNIARSRAKVASLHSIMSASTVMAALCVNDGGTVSPPLDAKTGGGNICSDEKIVDEKWPSLATHGMEGSGYQYSATNNSTIIAAEGGKPVITCNVSTGSCVKN